MIGVLAFLLTLSYMTIAAFASWEFAAYHEVMRAVDGKPWNPSISACLGLCYGAGWPVSYWLHRNDPYFSRRG